jgi:hypothetical protein
MVDNAGKFMQLIQGRLAEHPAIMAPANQDGYSRLVYSSIYLGYFHVG